MTIYLYIHLYSSLCTHGHAHAHTHTYTHTHTRTHTDIVSRRTGQSALEQGQVSGALTQNIRHFSALLPELIKQSRS